MHEFDTLRGRMDLFPAMLALIETRSVSLAAARLSVTQSAMSRTLAQIRDLIGDPVLVRSGNRMEPTARALSLLSPLRVVLAEAARLIEPVRFDPQTATRRFLALIPDVLAIWLVPPLLEQLRKQAPGCTLDLVPWERDSAAASIDFAVTSEIARFRDWRIEPLFDDHDQLARAAHRPPIEAPLEAPHIAVVAAGFSDDPVDRWLASVGKRRRIIGRVPHYLLAMQLVAHSDCVAILPSRLIAETGRAFGVVAQPLPFDIAADRIWLLHPARLDVEPAGQWLRALVRSVVAETIK